MNFFLIQNKDTEKLGGLVLRDDKGNFFYTAANTWFMDTLRELLKPKSYKLEVRQDERSILQVDVPKSDEKFIDVLKTKVLPPYVTYASGKVKSADAKFSVNQLWSKFSKDECQPIREV